MHKRLKGLIIAIPIFTLTLLYLAFPLSFSSSSLSANVNVICPFKVELNSLPTYIKYSEISINYSILSQYNCSIGNVSGYLNITPKNSNSIKYEKNINLSGLNREYNSTIVLNASSLPNNSTIYLSFSGENFYNTTKKSLLLILPANIIISKFMAVPNQANVNSQIIFSINLSNIGDMASNNILINFSISGPVSSNTIYTEAALSPGASENITIIEPENLTSVPGRYNATALITFNTSGYQNITGHLEKRISYIIMQNQYNISSSPSSPSPPKSKTIITSFPQLSILTFPIYISTEQGTQTTSSLNIFNTGYVPELLNMSVPQKFSGIISFSSKNIYINPKSSLSISLNFIGSNILTPGFYTIPINITTHIINGTTESEEEFVTLDIYNGTQLKPTVSTEVILTNNTSDAFGTIYISAPLNKSLSNLTLITKLPSSSAKNISQISAYGIQNNLTISDGYYNINWHIPYLQKGQNTYAYYQIKNISDQSFLQNTQNIFAAQSSLNPPSNLNVLKIIVPTFYTNSTNHISITSLYTGTINSEISFMLSNYGSLNIENPIQTFNVSPNKLFYTNFNISTNSSTGTMLIALLIKGTNTNYSYSIPILVTNRINNTEITNKKAQNTTNLTSQSFEYLINSTTIYIGVTLLFLFFLIIYLVTKMNKSRYSKERGQELRRIKDQVERSYDKNSD